MAYDTNKLIKLAALKELAEQIGKDFVAQSSLTTILFNALAEASEAGTFDGASAYEIAVAAGFEGDEAAWLESLKGEDGGLAYLYVEAGDDEHLYVVSSDNVDITLEDNGSGRLEVVYQ